MNDEIKFYGNELSLNNFFNYYNYLKDIMSAVECKLHRFGVGTIFAVIKAAIDFSPFCSTVDPQRHLDSS